jgi:hypothetical protein
MEIDSKILNQNFGLDTSIPHEPAPEDWIVGGDQVQGIKMFSKEAIETGRAWELYIPEGEFQRKNNLDTMACTCFDAMNQEEIYDRAVFGTDENRSDRFLAKLSGVTRQGGSPHNAREARRKYGYVPEQMWPFTPDMDWQEYMSPIVRKVLAEGIKNRDRWTYAHRYCRTERAEMFAMLEECPVSVIGRAWIKDSNTDLYIDGGYNPNHAFVIVGGKWKKNLLAYDSYSADFIYDDNSNKNEFLKKLDWNFRLGEWGKVITKTAASNDRTTLLMKLKNMFKNLKGYMDAKGLHIFYVDERGKQEITLSTIAEKALFMSYFKENIIKHTSWPELAGLPDFKFF